jgi:hypothetical protein
MNRNPPRNDEAERMKEEGLDHPSSSSFPT